MQRLEDAAHALVNELRTRRPETPMGKTDAIDFLCAKGLKRAQARNLLEAYDAQIHHKEGRWILQPLPGTRNKTGVFLCGVNPGGKLITTDRRQASSVELNNPEVCRQPPEPTANFGHPETNATPEPAERDMFAAGNTFTTEIPRFYCPGDPDFDGISTDPQDAASEAAAGSANFKARQVCRPVPRMPFPCG